MILRASVRHTEASSTRFGASVDVTEALKPPALGHHHEGLIMTHKRELKPGGVWCFVMQGWIKRTSRFYLGRGSEPSSLTTSSDSHLVVDKFPVMSLSHRGRTLS